MLIKLSGPTTIFGVWVNIGVWKICLCNDVRTLINVIKIITKFANEIDTTLTNTK